MSVAHQISFFDGSQPLKITKPIRLIECFAGYGSQALALKYLGVEFEHWKIAEWAVKSIQAYKDMHFPDDNTDYSAEYSKEWLIDYLFAKGISADYNKPMTREQIVRMGEEKIRRVYNNIISTHNLVSVTNVKGADLQITDTDDYTYILTYSFPCQDLSQAGLSKGMAKGSGTRSGLLWEIERILDECEELPQILLMENVPQVIGAKNRDAFRDWFMKLESLGYKSWHTIMNGKNYEIPQNRERCFMVSALGDCYYDFPTPKPLKLRLKDMLEVEVDEKYYLSDVTIERIKNWNAQQDPLKNIDKEKIVSPCSNARGAGEEHSGMILIKEPLACEIRVDEGIRTFEDNCMGTLRTIDACGCKHIIEPQISKCYQLDLQQNVIVRKHTVDIEKLKQCLRSHKCISNKEIANKLQLPQTKVEHYFRSDDCFSIPDANIWFELKKLLKIDTDEFDKSIMEFETKPNNFDMSNRAYVDWSCSPALTTIDSPKIAQCIGGIGEKKSNGGTQYYQQDRVYQGDIVLAHPANLPSGSYNYVVDEPRFFDYYNKREISGEYCGTLTTGTAHNGSGTFFVQKPKDYRIRKLTPKEAFRLMGVKDKDFERVAKNQSNSSLYHLSGDSIITNCLMAIFKQML